MKIERSSSLYFLEYISLIASLFYCFFMYFMISDLELHQKFMIYLFLLIMILFNNHFNGTRVHMYPQIVAFTSYGVAVLFETLEYFSFYLFLLMSVFSLLLIHFFNTKGNQYLGYEPSGKYQVGAKEVLSKMGQNRVMVFYPVSKDNNQSYPDYKWALDGQKLLKGITKFALDLVPQNPFYHLTNYSLNVKVGAPIIDLKKQEKIVNKKFVPIIFSHGVGCTTNWFSCICKEMASQGHIVYSIEHKDGTAFHYYDDKGTDKYMKTIDIRDLNSLVMKLGTRIKEIDQLIDEIQVVSNDAIGGQVDIDKSQLTIMGHGFGATTAISVASKDERIKRLITMDAWMFPIEEEVNKGIMKVSQAHCSINSEIFQHQVLLTDNWECLTQLFKASEQEARAKRDQSEVIQRKSQNKSGHLIAVLLGQSHMSFTDIALMMNLEMRIINFVPSFQQAFRGSYNIKLVSDIAKAFFILNGIAKESGNYTDIIQRLENTKDVTFDLK